MCIRLVCTCPAGNTRWAFAPFLAHAHYGGSYKWLLLGDDNTLWFMPGMCVFIAACRCHQLCNKGRPDDLMHGGCRPFTTLTIGT